MAVNQVISWFTYNKLKVNVANSSVSLMGTRQRRVLIMVMIINYNSNRSQLKNYNAYYVPDDHILKPYYDSSFSQNIFNIIKIMMHFSIITYGKLKINHHIYAD